MPDITGRCYCERVSYKAKDVSANIVECHCTQCRKQSGHRYASVLTDIRSVAIEDESILSWFSASAHAKRGFCSNCGSHMFWRSTTNSDIAILAASIDDASELTVASHIFVGDKGCYYEIDDGLPQFNGYDDPVKT